MSTQMKIAIIHPNKNMSEKIARVLTDLPGYKISWIADHWEEAIAKSRLNTPDILLVDLGSGNEGIATCSKIMQKTPCAILIITTNKISDASRIFEAMGHGALDAIALNWLKTDLDPASRKELIGKVQIIAKLLGKGSKFPKQHKAQEWSKPAAAESAIPPLLIIGSSTGGPAALARILSTFPKKIFFATIIIQHVDEKFTIGLAEWLSRYTHAPIKVAQNGSQPTSGTILIAGQNNHLVMTPFKVLKYTKEPAEKLFRPSIDVFFESVARNWPEKSIAVLLTGMGKDGAMGLKVLRDAGWYTIAEHQNSCIVYGMPKAAVAMGAATAILELDYIGPSILSFLNVKD